LITRVQGKSLIIQVRGFNEAKRWIDRCVSDGIVKCTGGNCWHAATHTFWQDRAEFYHLCESHRDYGPQWTGSTGWNPSSFSLPVLPDKIDVWLNALEPQYRKYMSLEDYDATDWYSLMTDDDFPQHLYFIGDERTGGWRASISNLKAGGYCYELERVMSRPGFSAFYSEGFFGDFPTVEACLTDARDRQAKL